MSKTSHIRLNITLPEETVTLLESVAGRGSRSSFIDTAIKRHVSEIRKEGLTERLKTGAIDRAERDRGIAADWENLEDDLWQD